MPTVRTRAGRVTKPTHRANAPDGKNRNNPSPEEVVEQIHGLTEQIAVLSSAMAEIQERFSEERPTAPPQPVVPSGMPPEPVPPPFPLRSYFESNFAYVDDSTRTQIASGTLDASHLVKLIPSDQRPKSSNVALTGNHLSFNLDTLQPSLSTDNSSNAALKHFPDFYSFGQALTIYAAIRDLYDPDHLGYSLAIHLHLHLLMTWCRQKLGWPGILNYAIAFFTKYQRCLPLAWEQQDVILYNAHITVYTQTHPNPNPNPNPNRPITSGSSAQRVPPSETICRNFNS